MGREKFSRIVLYIAFFLVLFYPFKGLFSLILSLILGLNVSSVIVRFSLIFTLFFVLLNLVINNITLPTKIDKILLYVGLFGLLVGVVKRDTMFLYNTVLLFGLPVLFCQFRKISDIHFFKYTFAFFSISTIYMLAEHIIVHPYLFGLNITPMSTEQMASFSSYLVNSTKDPSSFIIDDRNIGRYYRTGGYLAQPLAMASFLSMTAIFYYVLVREKPKLINLIFSILSAYLVLFSISTTAIIAFFLSVLVYEVFVRKGPKFLTIVILVTFGIGIFTYIIFSGVGYYIFQRLIFNLDNPFYYNKFFGYSRLLQPGAIITLLVGKWQWVNVGFSSHVDLIIIPLAYSGIVAFFLYNRMLSPIFVTRKSDSILGKVYSLVVLTPFFCLYHHTMTLNINVMFLVTLFILKSGDISARLGNRSKLFLSSSV